MARYIITTMLACILAGCGPGAPGDGARPLNTISDEEFPPIAVGRDMLATALRYDIDRFVGKNSPRLESVFLDVIGEEPSEDLMKRLEGAALKVRKFSSWATFSKNERGEPVAPERYLTLSVRDIRIFERGVAEVDTAWNVSGIALPGETFTLEFLGGGWRVTSTRFTPP